MCCKWQITLLMALALGLTGCYARITPAVQDKLDDPVLVYLLDFGRHSSLLLPREEEGRYARYSYGDWSWYLEGRRNWYRVPVVLLWPTRGGLGRGTYYQVTSTQELRRLAPDVYTFPAQKQKVQALQERLDSYFTQDSVSAAYSREFDLIFVPYPKGYWIFHQSNLKTAEWLRELGLDVRGYPLWSTWVVVEPPSD